MVGNNIYFTGFIDSIMTMFLMSLGEFQDVYAEFENTDHPMLAKGLFVIYMILASVLLVNMLIAMMGHTYEDIASRPNEWLRQWARIVLIVERGMSKEDRLATQQKYSEVRNGERVFVVKWETNVSSWLCNTFLIELIDQEEECKEIDELKELCAENRINFAKLKKRKS